MSFEFTAFVGYVACSWRSPSRSPATRAQDSLWPWLRRLQKQLWRLWTLCPTRDIQWSPTNKSNVLLLTAWKAKKVDWLNGLSDMEIPLKFSVNYWLYNLYIKMGSPTEPSNFSISVSTSDIIFRVMYLLFEICACPLFVWEKNQAKAPAKPPAGKLRGEMGDFSPKPPGVIAYKLMTSKGIWRIDATEWVSCKSMNIHDN